MQNFQSSPPLSNTQLHSNSLDILQNYIIQIPQTNQFLSMQQMQQMRQQIQIQEGLVNHMNQLTQLVQNQFCHPMQISQFLMNQFSTLTQQQLKIQTNTTHKSSCRTIEVDDMNSVKLEHGVEKQVISTHEQDPKPQLDINVISGELRVLITYLSKEEIPKQSTIRQYTKNLSQINQQIVSIIMDRHQQQRKTKEEQIKFVLRKCFKYLKTNLDIDQGIITPLDMEKRFYKVYFEGEEEMIPFRKNSNMKTMNSQYLRKIFLSPTFVNGFKDYIIHFDQIWDAENDEKIENMVKQVVLLIQQNRIGKLHTYRRLPWIASIKNKCKTLAHAMLKYAPKLESDAQKQA